MPAPMTSKLKVSVEIFPPKVIELLAELFPALS